MTLWGGMVSIFSPCALSDLFGIVICRLDTIGRIAWLLDLTCNRVTKIEESVFDGQESERRRCDT